MPIANIPINTTTTKGQQLSALVATVYSARNLAKQLVELMQEETDFSNYATIETLFGLPTGQGANVYSLVLALTTSAGLESAGVIQFCSRLG